MTAHRAVAERVAEELKRQLESLPRRAIATSALRNYGAIIVVSNLEEACSLVNELAPEHVEIITSDDDAVSAQIKHAGAIFFGSYTPEAVGDYLAGPNHVLPTGRTARFSSALGVYDFVKRTSLLQYSPDAFASVADHVSTLAECEGLAAHARSATIRKQK
jgi:histidinol dehydrogenase